jgi:hypothetical protein
MNKTYILRRSNRFSHLSNCSVLMYYLLIKYTLIFVQWPVHSSLLSLMKFSHNFQGIFTWIYVLHMKYLKARYKNWMIRVWCWSVLSSGLASVKVTQGYVSGTWRTQNYMIVQLGHLGHRTSNEKTYRFSLDVFSKKKFCFAFKMWVQVTIWLQITSHQLRTWGGGVQNILL